MKMEMLKELTLVIRNKQSSSLNLGCYRVFFVQVRSVCRLSGDECVKIRASRGTADLASGFRPGERVRQNAAPGIVSCTILGRAFSPVPVILLCNCNYLCFGIHIVIQIIIMTRRAERVITEIKEIFRPGAEKPSNIAKAHSALYLRACKVFGSWRNALEASGVDYESSRNNKKWTRQSIEREIKKLSEGGGSLRPSVLRKSGMTALVSAADYHFGSWRKAVESCGVEYEFARRRRGNYAEKAPEPFTRYAEKDS